MPGVSGVVEHVLGPNGEIVEVVVKAPAAEMKLAAAQQKIAPPTETEIAEAALVVAQEEHDEANVQRVAAATIATVAVALAYMVLRGETPRVRSRGLDGAQVLIPREIVDRVTGAKLGISETADRDVILRWRTRAERPIEPEEMRLNGK